MVENLPFKRPLLFICVSCFHHVVSEGFVFSLSLSPQTSAWPSAEQQRPGSADMDYFEKFSLLDEVVPTEQSQEGTEDQQEQPPGSEVTSSGVARI